MKKDEEEEEALGEKEDAKKNKNRNKKAYFLQFTISLCNKGICTLV